MRKIKLTHDKYALVDDDNFPYLNQWRWKYHKDNYAVRTTTNGKQIYMHRVVNQTPEDMVTDHINRNGLDNRRCNLRSVTIQQNAFNAGLPRNNKSGVKGVTWNKNRQLWQAQINIGAKCKFLGVFSDINEAAIARKKAEETYAI